MASNNYLSDDRPPLDEIMWTSPQLVQELGGIHTNTVLFYFHESPFFDKTSNNGVVFQQARFNPEIVGTRLAFEKYLEGMNGLEYRIVQDPSKSDRIPNYQHTGVWVIRKQERSVAVYDPVNGEVLQEAFVKPLSTYFIVNESVYMAPTIADVLRSRILSISNALNKAVAAASTIPIHDPAQGRVYAPTAAKLSTSGALALNTARNSREATPLPDARMLPISEGDDVSEDDDKDSSDPRQAALLMETLTNNLRYGREYMDEHPLMGEPGNFIIQKSKDLQVPIGNENAAREKRTLPIPPPIKTDIAEEAEKKAKDALTAGAAGEKSPLSPTGGKKRKKSKAQTPRTPKPQNDV